MSYTYEEFRAKLREYNCERCSALCSGRNSIVVDRGNPDTNLMVIGEAPGEDEDWAGQAFVGRAGQLLDKIFASIGLNTNKDMLIVNMVKCRPPNNRPPTPDEVQNCSNYLNWQINKVNPRFVVLLGATAAKGFLQQPDLLMKNIVGKPLTVGIYPGKMFMILYHPAFLLRNPNMKSVMWEHVKVLKALLDNS
jgi:uracil-DNA glycosylase family 4